MLLDVEIVERLTWLQNGCSSSRNSTSHNSTNSSCSAARLVGIVAAIVMIRHFPRWRGGSERPQDTLTLVISNNNGEEMINTLQPSPWHSSVRGAPQPHALAGPTIAPPSHTASPAGPVIPRERKIRIIKVTTPMGLWAQVTIFWTHSY